MNKSAGKTIPQSFPTDRAATLHGPRSVRAEAYPESAAGQGGGSVSPHPSSDPLEVGLVLGGGGARGLAHLGVLAALEALDYQPVAIAGCSVGSIVGALYAAGHSPAAIQELVAQHQFPALELLRSGEHGSLLSSRWLDRALRTALPETFEALSFPLAVTAVDVESGELVVIRSGDLISALRASSALPGLLSPVLRDGKLLIDGGLLNNLPVDVIRTLTSAPVIAVDVAVPADRPLREKGRLPPPVGWWSTLRSSSFSSLFAFPRR